MAKKGRPAVYMRGEDKPVTMSLRLSKELHTRIESYAHRHRQTFSELVRDGLEWRLGDGDPHGEGHSFWEPGASAAPTYYSNTLGAGNGVSGGTVPSILDTILARLDALTEAVAQQALQYSNTVMQHTSESVVPAVVPANSAPTGQAPAIDTTMFFLGPPCPKGHTYQDSDLTLRYLKSGLCRVCHLATMKTSKAKAKARRKAQAPATGRAKNQNAKKAF